MSRDNNQNLHSFSNVCMISIMYFFSELNFKFFTLSEKYIQYIYIVYMEIFNSVLQWKQNTGIIGTTFLFLIEINLQH